MFTTECFVKGVPVKCHRRGAIYNRMYCTEIFDRASSRHRAPVQASACSKCIAGDGENDELMGTEAQELLETMKIASLSNLIRVV